MAPPSLLEICLVKTCDFVETGVWDSCEDNPFSSMPSSIVQDLLYTMLPEESQLCKCKIVRFRPVLSSGRLQYVNLFRSRPLPSIAQFDLDHSESRDLCSRPQPYRKRSPTLEYMRFFQKMYRKMSLHRSRCPNDPYQGQLFRMLSRGCQNLRMLSLPYCESPSQVRNFPELLHNCTNLEELLSPVSFNLLHLKNCRKLKSLKFHFYNTSVTEFSSCISPHSLKYLTSLELFTYCGLIHPETTEEADRLLSVTVAVLDVCLKLTSLGFLDSSMALKKIHCRDGRTSVRTFQLREGYWNTNKYITGFEYSEAIRVAAWSCPLMKVLEMTVRFADSLKCLKALEKLTTLHLNFDDCDDAYEHELNALLEAIGSRLQTLSVFGKLENPVNISLICNACCNLRNLTLCCGVVSTKPGVNLPYLKYCYADAWDRTSLLSFLSNSVHLKKLDLEDCMALDDSLMIEILKKNPFSELEEVNISGCSLSKLGLTKLLDSARKLRDFSLEA